MSRDVREIVRDEPLMRSQILALVADEPLTIPELAGRLGCPTDEVVHWVMAMRKYGQLAEVKDADGDYFRYGAAR